MNKLLRFRSWSIMAKLSGLTTLSFLPLFIVLVFYIMPAFEEKFLEDKKQQIKTAVESTFNIIDYYDQKASSGAMTLEEAQKTAGEEITALRYSGKEYFFMYDLDGNTKALGSDPKKIGTNRLELKDAKNVYFVKEMVKISREKGEGYVTYFYPKLGDTVAYPKISFIKYHSKWGFFIGNGVYIDDVDKAISEFRIKIIIPTLIVLLIAIGFGYIVAKKVSTPIKQLDSAAKEVAKGNTSISVKLELEDEIGDLAHNFNQMTRSIAESIESVNAEKRLAEAALNEAEVAKKNAQEQEKYLAEHVELMLHEMERFAEGDLTIHLSESDSGNMGQLFRGFNRSVRNIRSMMMKVTEVVQSTTMASAQISSSTEELASGAQEQTMQTHQVASAIEEMTTTIIQTTRNASEAADNARIAKQIALDGGKVVNETIDGIIKIANVVNRASETVSQLGDNSDKIGEIIQVIDDIADQTNLLALNAAIEAARAGEQGRGFAVVADEVRKLAERTTKATKEIAVMIKNIQSDTHLAVSSIVEGSKEVEKGKALANKAGGALKEIITAAQKVMDEVSQVATASEEQSSTAADIGQSVNGINAITQQSSIGTQQIAEVATGLHALTNRLKEQIQEFRL